MDLIIPPLIDLVKYKINVFVNTGDRAFDSLVIILVSVSFAVFTKYLTAIVSSCWNYFFARINGDGWLRFDRKFIIGNVEISSDTYKLDMRNVDKLNCELLAEQIARFPRRAKERTIPIQIGEKNRSMFIAEWLPIYCHGGKIVYMTCEEAVLGNRANPASVTIKCNSPEAVNSFLGALRLEKAQGNKILSVLDMNGLIISEINRERTFDNYVSRHKERILKSVDSFKSGRLANLYPGFMRNNLGIMLYGPPGSGKTSLVKCLCNYLQRDAVVVDFSKIKTASKLSKLLETKTDERIFVFDEFDCILGVLDGKRPERKSQEWISALASCGEKDKAVFLKEYKKAREEEEDSITLQSLLTILDGIVEYKDRVIVATTNHPENINSALMRAGRFDIKVKLDLFEKEEIVEMLGKVFQPKKKEKEWLLRQDFPRITPVDLLQEVAVNESLKDVVSAVQRGKDSEF